MTDAHGGFSGTHLIEVRSETTNYAETLEKWKDTYGVRFVLAFSGGADDDSPILQYLKNRIANNDSFSEDSRGQFQGIVNEANDKIIGKIVRDVLAPLRDYRIAIQTGGTKFGVPRVATQVANELGFPTIGVFPLTAQVNKHVDDCLDLAVCVHPFVGKSQWGDESAIFTKLLDAVIVIGGGAGTMVEVAHLLKINERKNDVTKHIIPVHGTHGTAQVLSSFPGKPETMARCIPGYSITSGGMALKYLIENTFIEDVYEPKEGASS